MKTSEIPIWSIPITSGWVICTVEVSPGEFRLRRVVKDQVGAAGQQGVQGLKGDPAGLHFQYSSNTTEADPGSGKIRFNNAAPVAASNMFISGTDENGNVEGILFFWDFSTSANRSILVMRKVSDPSSYVSWVIDAPGTDNGPWNKFPLVGLSSNGSFLDNDEVTIEFFITGEKGNTGPAGPFADGRPGGGIALLYLFDNSNTTTPVAGDISFDTNTLINVQHVYVNENDNEGSNDIGVLVLPSTAGDSLFIYDKNTPADYVVLTVISHAIMGGGVHHYTVTPEASNGSFTNNSDIVFSFQKKGNTGATGAMGSMGATGAAGRNEGLKYTYSTTTTAADPGSGTLRFNNTTLTSATAFYISETDGDSNALAALFATWDDSTSTIRGTLTMRKDSDPSVFAVFSISGTLTDNGSWDTFTVAGIVSSGAFVNNDIVKLNFTRTGDLGATGATGATGAAGTSGLLTSDGWAVEFFDDYSVGASPTLDKGFGWGANGAGSGLSIVSRNNVNTTENRLEIIAGQYGRKFAWGDDWHRLILCMICRINRGSNFTSGKSYFGLCSGTTNMVASASTDNFIGHNFDAITMTFNAGTKLSFFSTANSMRYSTRRSTTTTDQGSGSGSDGRRWASAEANKTMWLVDIARPVFALDSTSITYSLSARETSSANCEFPASKHGLLDVLDEQVTATLGTNGTAVMGGSQTSISFSFDQSTGKFDTLNISWVESFGFELSCIGVRKVY